MGNACTNNTRNRDVIVPNTIKDISRIKNRIPNIQNGNLGNETPQILNENQSNVIPNNSAQEHLNEVDNTAQSKTNAQQSLLKINNSELGIGEHYLESEISDYFNKLSERNKNKLLKNGQKWDHIPQKIKFVHVSQDSLYNETDLYLREYAIKKQKKWNKILKKGIPQKYRWSAWKINVEINKFYEKGLYQKLIKLSSNWEEDIRKDVHRTFPREKYFSSEKYGKIGQIHLSNVLKAISLYLPHIGYAQSMNYIVAFLLLVNGGKDEEAFWMFITLARDHKFLAMGLFEKQFPLLEFYKFIFYELLQRELPALYQHIHKQQFPDLLWLFKWFLTLFLYSFPPKHVIRIWDFILAKGLFSMIQIAVSILKFIEKDMINLDIPGMDMLFKYLKEEEPMTDNAGHQVPSVEEIKKISSVHYSFKELNIDQILKHAEKIPLGYQRISSFTHAYKIKTGKSLPILYEKFFTERPKIKNDKDKLLEFQVQVEAHLNKIEETGKTNPNQEDEKPENKVEEGNVH